MKILAFMTKGTEDSELIITVDLLRRANILVTTVSLDSEYIELSHNIIIKADRTLDSMSDDEISSYDGLFLPGGKEGTMTFRSHEKLKSIINEFNENKKLISAICAAPSVFGVMGLLNNKNYTCYNGWEEESFKGNYLDTETAKDSNIITGKSLNYSVEFSLELIEYLLGEDERNKVSKGILRY